MKKLRGIKMEFVDTYEAISELEIKKIEKELGFSIPDQLKTFYLKENGGIPKKTIFHSDNLDTIVPEFLPLKSNRRINGVVESYKNLVLEQELCPVGFLPFCVDGGGDYFFVDCTNKNCSVYFFSGDSFFNNPDEGLLDLNLDFQSFCDALKEE
jgi:hypothetical protein